MAATISNVMVGEIAALITGDTPYMALYKTNPGAADTGTEVTGGGYARQPITFGSVSGGQISNTVAVSFSSLPTANITHFGIRDALTAGDLKISNTLSATATVVSGDEVTFPIGSITVPIVGA